LTFNIYKTITNNTNWLNIVSLSTRRYECIWNPGFTSVPVLVMWFEWETVVYHKLTFANFHKYHESRWRWITGFITSYEKRKLPVIVNNSKYLTDQYLFNSVFSWCCIYSELGLLNLPCLYWLIDWLIDWLIGI